MELKESGFRGTLCNISTLGRLGLSVTDGDYTSAAPEEEAAVKGIAFSSRAGGGEGLTLTRAHTGAVSARSERSIGRVSDEAVVDACRGRPRADPNCSATQCAD